LGDKKVNALLFGLMLLLVISLTLDDSVFADKKGDKNTTAIINLGFLQLAAHDFFNMNRCLDPEVELVHPFENLTFLPDCEVKDSENAKLDLSTVLFNPHAGECNFKKSLNDEGICALYDDDTIANGVRKEVLKIL